MTAPDFSFGGVSIPSDMKRLYVSAILKPSMGDPRIQPTGFPDIGPVLYPDPSGAHGQICLIESEASMANRLEEVAVADKYTGTLLPELAGLPYIRAMKGERFMTASTIDGHRFASEYIMKANFGKPASNGVQEGADEKKDNGPFAKHKRLVDYMIHELGGSKDDIPAANVPRIFRLVMELDPLALIHGFQISLKGELTFVGLRSPRALTACIVGLNAQPVGVPGARIDPIGTGDVGQAIFRKERIVAEKIEAKFSIDIGLITGLAVEADPLKNETDSDRKKRNEVCDHRRRLLVALSLWKVAKFLKDLSHGHRLRTECDLVLESAKYKTKWNDESPKDFVFDAILKAASAKKEDKKDADGSLQDLIAKAELVPNRSPLTVEYGGK